jgi:protein-S-isoprenylcysteine O-methyltransferase
MRMGRMPHWDIFFLIGIVLILIGMIIRIYSIKTLSQQFTYTVTNIEDHKLIKTGLYKNIRHPGYLGQIIIFTATAIALSNWLSILAMLIPVISGYLYRISIEEKFLIKQLGQEYIDYQKETRKLIPKIF